jgi:hypothetical protein
VFKFEGLADLADIAEKGDHLVSYDLLKYGDERDCNVLEEIGIRVLPYLDDLFFPKRGVRAYWLVE